MNASVKDYQEILSTIDLYIRGCAEGRGDLMAPAFHEAATINGAPIKTLFDGCDKAGPTNSQAQADILDVAGDIAVVRVTLENYHGADYVDFHALKKIDGKWQILAKVFTDK